MEPNSIINSVKDLSDRKICCRHWTTLWCWSQTLSLTQSYLYLTPLHHSDVYNHSECVLCYHPFLFQYLSCLLLTYSCVSLDGLNTNEPWTFKPKAHVAVCLCKKNASCRVAKVSYSTHMYNVGISLYLKHKPRWVLFAVISGFLTLPLSNSHMRPGKVLISTRLCLGLMCTVSTFGFIKPFSYNYPTHTCSGWVKQ